jgi:hypothetical protein
MGHTNQNKEIFTHLLLARSARYAELCSRVGPVVERGDIKYPLSIPLPVKLVAPEVSKYCGKRATSQPNFPCPFLLSAIE